VALVRERTIPTERPPLVGEVNANLSTVACDAKTEEQLGPRFLCSPCLGYIARAVRAISQIPALGVVSGDGKGTQYLGVYLGHSVPGEYKYGDLALQVGRVSRTGTIRYGLDFRGAALARTTSSNSNLQTRPLVREGVTK
jgi:hypothetical protein